MKKPCDLTEYEKKILSIFAEAYPQSAHFRGGRNLRKGNWGKLFPGIRKNIEDKESFLAAVDRLCEAGILSARWKRFREGDELSALYLESPGMLYAMLDIPSPEETIQSAHELLGQFKAENNIAADTAKYINERLRAREIPFADIPFLRDILTLVSTPTEEAHFSSLRALSVKLFKDSKRIESLIPGLDSLTVESCGIVFSDYYDLKRLYPETTISGSADIILNDGREWQMRGESLTLPVSTVENIQKIRIPFSAPDVLSVENKETFYTLSSKNEFSVYIYCGGYPNRADRALLECLSDSNAEIYHAGDLDPDGLLIFQEIDCMIEGRLKPFFMNEAVYSKYLSFGYELSPAVLKKLSSVNSAKLSELASTIGKKEIGVEQEIISYE